MTLSLCLTVNERKTSDLERVFDSIAHQDHNELVICLDRTPEALEDWIGAYWQDDKRVTYAKVIGQPGWKSPVMAWNAAFEAAEGELLYCISSDTVQEKGNVGRALDILEKEPAVLHGRAECSCGPQGQEVNWGGTAPGNLLCDSAHPRPLGFIWAAPAANVKAIGGFDPEFDDGLWYDDNDFFLRLWRTGLDFHFADAVSGVHLHHDRPVLQTQEGARKIQRNAALMQQKHGTQDPWPGILKTVSYEPGRTIWRHL